MRPGKKTRKAAEPGPAPRRRVKALLLGVGAAGLVLSIAAGGWWWYSGRQPRALLAGASAPARPAASYVGQQVCGQCHEQVEQRWRGSHHDLAMQPATETSVAGRLQDARFTYAGVTSSFFRRDGKFVVRTDGPDGTLHDYEIKYTFGVAPLQQYLIELPDGRLQALGIAWDTRPRAQGGQRWFHLYPGQNVTHRDELHWTGLSQNWNYMCAECHSTGVRKNYDPGTRRFSHHLRGDQRRLRSLPWPRLGPRRLGPEGGRLAALRRRRRGSPSRSTSARASRGRSARTRATRSARRRAGRPARSRLCGRCHARRGQFADDLRARPAARRHPPGRAARRPPLLPRRADARRGVRVRLVPADRRCSTRA